MASDDGTPGEPLASPAAAPLLAGGGATAGPTPPGPAGRGAAEPLSVPAAARVLGLSVRSVRFWAAEGVLLAADGHVRPMRLDAGRVEQVAEWLDQLRAAAAQADTAHPGGAVRLVDAVHRRLVDSTWADREDLQVSLAQMAAGLGTLRIRHGTAEPPANP